MDGGFSTDEAWLNINIASSIVATLILILRFLYTVEKLVRNTYTCLPGMRCASLFTFVTINFILMNIFLNTAFSSKNIRSFFSTRMVSHHTAAVCPKLLLDLIVVSVEQLRLDSKANYKKERHNMSSKYGDLMDRFAEYVFP